MYRTALRSAPRGANALKQAAVKTTVPRRFASTSPVDKKKRSWKGSAVRWGLAVGAVYWYNTSPVFVEEALPTHVLPPPQFSDDDLPTVEAVVAQKRKEAEARLAKATPKDEAAAPAAPAAEAKSDVPDNDAEASAPPGEALSGPEALEAEANQQGAFNPETGEINWDCPCLGGMADGPCGEEFKAAFSCFVYSKEEPKGMDCIDKFQHMQDCFRLHPEVYGDELADELADADEEAPAGEGASETEDTLAKTSPEAGVNAPAASTVDAKSDVQATPSDAQPSALAPTAKTESQTPKPSSS